MKVKVTEKVKCSLCIKGFRGSFKKNAIINMTDEEFYSKPVQDCISVGFLENIDESLETKEVQENNEDINDIEKLNYNLISIKNVSKNQIVFSSFGLTLKPNEVKKISLENFQSDQIQKAIDANLIEKYNNDDKKDVKDVAENKEDEDEIEEKINNISSIVKKTKKKTSKKKATKKKTSKKIKKLSGKSENKTEVYIHEPKDARMNNYVDNNDSEVESIFVDTKTGEKTNIDFVDQEKQKENNIEI